MLGRLARQILLQRPRRPSQHSTRLRLPTAEELRIALSLLVTQEIEQWDLAALKQRADTLAEQVSDTALAREIQAMSQRMEEFATLQRRHQQAQEGEVSSHQVGGASANVPTMTETRSGQTIRLPVRTTTSTSRRLRHACWKTVLRDIDAAIGSAVAQASADSEDSPYDAEGWLMPVHSTKRVAPPFAVLDDDGRVRAYVTPAQGLNLRRYAKQYVGLIGQRRYVDSLRAPHITAERVIRQRGKE